MRGNTNNCALNAKGLCFYPCRILHRFQRLAIKIYARLIENFISENLLFFQWRELAIARYYARTPLSAFLTFGMFHVKRLILS